MAYIITAATTTVTTVAVLSMAAQRRPPSRFVARVQRPLVAISQAVIRAMASTVTKICRGSTITSESTQMDP